MLCGIDLLQPIDPAANRVHGPTIPRSYSPAHPMSLPKKAGSSGRRKLEMLALRPPMQLPTGHMRRPALANGDR